MKTIESFVSDINRWLQVRWSIAEYFKQLPGFDETLSYMLKQFKSTVESVPASEWAWERMESDGNSTGWNIYMLDMVSGSESTVKIISAVDPDGKPFCSFRLLGEQMEMENDKKFAIRKVEVDELDGSLSFAEVMSTGALIARAKGDFWARWMLAPASFRLKYPICPQCGAPVACRNFGDYNRPEFRMTCDTCDWTAQKKDHYTTLDDYVETDCKTERKVVVRRYKTHCEVTQAVSAASTALDNIERMLKNKKAYDQTPQLYLPGLTQLEKRVHQLKELAEQASQKKK